MEIPFHSDLPERIPELLKSDTLTPSVLLRNNTLWRISAALWKGCPVLAAVQQTNWQMSSALPPVEVSCIRHPRGPNIPGEDAANHKLQAACCSPWQRCLTSCTSACGGADSACKACEFGKGHKTCKGCLEVLGRGACMALLRVKLGRTLGFLFVTSRLAERKPTSQGACHC